MHNANAQGLAAGLIVSALLDTLHKKGALDLSEVRNILDAARNGAAPYIKGDPVGMDASRIITGMMAGRFSERRD